MCPGLDTKGLPFIGQTGQGWEEPVVQWGEWVEVAWCHSNIGLFSGGAAQRSLCWLRLGVGKVQGLGKGETVNVSLTEEHFVQIG